MTIIISIAAIALAWAAFKLCARVDEELQ